MEGSIDDAGEIHGTEAMDRCAHDWLDTFENVTLVPEELLDLGDDRVMAVQRLTGRARRSGVETNLRYAVVYTLSDGKVVRREYDDRQQALEASGLAG